MVKDRDTGPGYPCDGCGYLIYDPDPDIIEVYTGDLIYEGGDYIVTILDSYKGNPTLWRGHRACYEKDWTGKKLPPGPVRVVDENQSKISDGMWYDYDSDDE